MKIIFFHFFMFYAHLFRKIKLEEIPRLNTTTALKILIACHQESMDQKVEVAIVIVGIDGRILASSKSEKMDPGLYDFAKFKAETSCFKGVATEDLPARNGRDLEIMDIGSLKVIRGVQEGILFIIRAIRCRCDWRKWCETGNRQSDRRQRNRRSQRVTGHTNKK